VKQTPLYVYILSTLGIRNGAKMSRKVECTCINVSEACGRKLSSVRRDYGNGLLDLNDLMNIARYCVAHHEIEGRKNERVG